MKTANYVEKTNLKNAAIVAFKAATDALVVARNAARTLEGDARIAANVEVDALRKNYFAAADVVKGLNEELRQMRKDGLAVEAAEPKPRGRKAKAEKAAKVEAPAPAINTMAELKAYLTGHKIEFINRGIIVETKVGKVMHNASKGFTLNSQPVIPADLISSLSAAV